jgi:hypothetical protein
MSLRDVEGNSFPNCWLELVQAPKIDVFLDVWFPINCSE